MNVPSNLRFTNDHEWLKLEGDTAIVGITEYAASQLGDIVFIDVNTVGETLNAEEVFGSIEAVKTVSDLFLPAGGEVIEFNEELEGNPALVNQDPYNEGWIIKVKVSDATEIENLLTAEAYAAIIE